METMNPQAVDINRSAIDSSADIDEEYYSGHLTLSSSNHSSEEEGPQSPLIGRTGGVERSMSLKNLLGSKRDVLRERFKRVSRGSMQKIGQGLSGRSFSRKVEVEVSNILNNNKNDDDDDDDDDASMASSMHSEEEVELQLTEVGELSLTRPRPRVSSAKSIDSQIDVLSKPRRTVSSAKSIDSEITFPSEEFAHRSNNRSSVRSNRSKSGCQGSGIAEVSYRSDDGRRLSVSQFEPSLEFSVRSDPGTRLDILEVEESPSKPKKKLRGKKPKKVKKVDDDLKKESTQSKKKKKKKNKRDDDLTKEPASNTIEVQ